MVIARPNIGTLELEQPLNLRISPRDSLRGFGILTNKGTATVRASPCNSDLDLGLDQSAI